MKGRQPLTAEEAFALVQKRKGKGWGVIWDPLANPTPAGSDLEDGDKCTVVDQHDGLGCSRIRGHGPTWETALAAAGSRP